MNKTELFIKLDKYNNESLMFDDTYLTGSVYGTVLGLEFQMDVNSILSVGDIITIDKTDKSINPWADGTASIIGITSSSVFPAPGSLVFTDRPLQSPTFTSNENGVIYQGSTISSNWNQVDLSDDVAFPITFNIADVREINNRNGAYSKTIVIPGTKDNNRVFKYIFDIQGIDNYDTRVRVKANVVVDTIPVLEGYIQLDTINCDNNEYWSYNCIIYGENANFSKNIDQNALLNNLDFTEFDHYKTLDAITQSWVGDYTNGYYYPLLDCNNGKNPVDIFSTNTQALITQASQLSYTNENFKPSIYVKQYWDKIFKLYGYSYESDFLNSEAFTNLVIPTNVKVIQNDDDWRFNSSFKAGITTLATASVSFNNSVSNQTPPVSSQIGLNDNFLTPWSMSVANPFFYNPQNLFVDIGGGSFRYENTYLGSVPKNQKIILQLDYKITPVGNGFNNLNGLGFLLYYRLFKNGTLLSQRKVQTFGGEDTFFSNGLGPFVYQTNYDYVINNYGAMDDYTSASFNRRQMKVVYDTSVDGDLVNGDTMEVRVGMALFATNVNNSSDATNFTNTRYDIDFYPSTNGYDGCYYYNDINTALRPDQPYRLNSSIPGNIKQIDFINSIIKMFNLYLNQDKVDPKKIYIEPRDQFYTTDFVDWSRKLDISKDILQKPIVDRKKRVFMSYKEDKDLINTYYKSTYNQIYGQYEYITGNEFDTTEQKIEVIFSPSPLSNRKLSNGVLDNSLIYTQILDPKATINSENYNIVDSNIRILYRKNIPLTGTNFRIFDFQSYYSYNTYPYAGHLDDPTSPGLDLSFSFPVELFYEYQNFGYTNNNLYTLYYEQFFEEIYGIESKHIVAYVYLTAQDILDFDYRKLVYLDNASSGSGGYFRVNKIEYDPFNKRSYKVELIKVLNNFKLEYKKIIDVETEVGEVGLSLPVWGTGLVTPGNYNSGSGNVINGVDNSVRSNFNIVGGDSNQVLVGGSNIVTGYKNNTISDNSGIISGGESTIYGTGRYSNIIGGASHSLSGRYSSIIGGCNNKIDIYSSNNQILGGCNNKISYNITGTTSASQTSNSLILGGINNTIEIGPTPSATDNVFIIGGQNNTIASGITSSFIINGENFTATQSNTIYLEGNVLINGLAPSVVTPIPNREIAFGDGTGIQSDSSFKLTSGRSLIVSNNSLTDSSSSSGLAFGTNTSTIAGNNNNIISTKTSTMGGSYNSILSSYYSCSSGCFNSSISTIGTKHYGCYNSSLSSTGNIFGTNTSASSTLGSTNVCICDSSGSIVSGTIISSNSTKICANGSNLSIIGAVSSCITGTSNNSVILASTGQTMNNVSDTVLMTNVVIKGSMAANSSSVAIIAAANFVIVGNGLVTANSAILLTGDLNATFWVTAIIPGTSFRINASAVGTYNVSYLIIN
jgi:hypothetical protein